MLQKELFRTLLLRRKANHWPVVRSSTAFSTSQMLHLKYRRDQTPRLMLQNPVEIRRKQDLPPNSKNYMITRSSYLLIWTSRFLREDCRAIPSSIGIKGCWLLRGRRNTIGTFVHSIKLPRSSRFVVYSSRDGVQTVEIELAEKILTNEGETPCNTDSNNC